MRYWLLLLICLTVMVYPPDAEAQIDPCATQMQQCLVDCRATNGTAPTATRQCMVDCRTQIASCRASTAAVPAPSGRRPDMQQIMAADADRQTQSLLQALRAELPGTTLFADRQTETRESERERTQLATYASWSEPTDVEIGLALMRAYAVNNGRLTSSYEVERVLPQTAGAAALNLKLLDVQRLLHVQKTRPCTRVGPRWHCNARVWLHLFQRGNALMLADLAPQNPVLAILAAANAKVMEGNGTPSDYILRATEEGFTAPTLAKAIRDGDERRNNRMNDAAHRRECGQYQRERDQLAYALANCTP